MNTRQKTVLGTAAAAVAIIAVLFAGTYSPSQLQNVIESNTIVAAETFDVTPITTNVDTVQFDASVGSSIVVPVTTNIESDPEAANFILPFLNEAHAVTATQTSLTNTEWQSLPTGTNSIAYDAVNDDIWFSGHGTNKVIRLDLTSGALTQWPVLSGSDVSAIALDPTGRVYFAMSTNTDKLGRLDPATNSIIEWFLPSSSLSNRYISQVVYDPISGHVIYIRTSSNTSPSNSNDFRIGKLNPSSNQVTEWTNLCFAAIAWCVERFGVDPVNGDIYFFEEWTNTMKRIRPSAPSTLTSWAVPQPGANVIGVTVNSAQTVFAAENGGNRIMRLVTTGPSINQVTQWLLPTGGNQPFSITTSPTDEAVYFTEYNAGKIGRIVPSSNLFTEWTLPTAGLRPTQVITDASGNLYWSVDNSGRIGRLS